jgi:DNA-binding CsgD family transcriptional regulator/tetratricopeptide (TPR) repeat protein
MPLVGRLAELQTFESLWVDVEEARRQVVFVGGEPGAGKTRLAAEVAGALHDDDVAVLVGTSTADGGVPYQPFAEMLDHLFSSAPEGTFHVMLDDDSRRELARLSTYVPRHGGSGSSDEAAPAGDVRRELFDAVARLFRRLAEDRPVALILDDLHWAQLPTVALLEHVVHSCPDVRMLVVATFRTTAPDRSDEISARVAELHRLDGVRRLDLSGLDAGAIAEYVSIRGGLPLNDARAPAVMLRDHTGGNPFLLRELWADLERRGGVSTLRSSHRVPSSIADALSRRLDGLGDDVRHFVELAAVVGDTFDLATLVAASEDGHAHTMASVDAATAAGLVEEMEGAAGVYSFVHSLTRQAVLDRMPPSRRMRFHAQVAEALERQPVRPSLVPRLAHHYLAAHVLGHHEQALRHTTDAGRLAERGLAFEEAAVWFERAAALPDCDRHVRAELLFSAATNCVRAGRFPRARAIYDQLTTTPDPLVRLAAAMGYEDTNWRPGLADPRTPGLLSAAIDESGLDHTDARYVRALGSLGRALAFAGQTDRARATGDAAIDAARLLDDDATLTHALTTSLWHGTAPDIAQRQLERTRELSRLAKAAGDHETAGSAGNFGAMVGYLVGRPDVVDEGLADVRLAAQATSQPYYRHIVASLEHARAFLRGDFAAAERWADETLVLDETFGDDMTEGPHGVQMFMIRRETGALLRFRSYLDGRESFIGRWVPGLLALYTELRIEVGIARALRHLLDRRLEAHTDEAQWPMELVFMAEAALALEDEDAVRRLRPLVSTFAGMNVASGALIAAFGSADRYLGRIAGFLGDHTAAERHFETALEMDRRMHSVVHTTETLAHWALFLAGAGQADRSRPLATEARAVATPIGQERVLALLEPLARQAGPDGLTDREVDVLRLLAGGLSNREIGERLHISANTAANHIRSILMKTGAANRTQAAMYAADHQLA